MRKQVTLDEAKALGAIAKVEDGDKVAYFKAPSRLITGIALSEFTENMTSACEKIFHDCVIQEISDAEHWLEDDGRFNGIVVQLQGLIRVKKSTWTAL